MIYTLSIAGLVLIALFLLWQYRMAYIDYLPGSISSRIRHYAPLSTFESAMENGFSTTNFDLTNNLSDDQRAGLDEQGLTEVRRIMERYRVDFDEARRIRTNQHFKKNGVDEFGFPIDPKAITRLS